MGYNIELFQNRKEAKKFICVVCSKVVSNPMFVGDCEHFVCGGCLTEIEKCPHNNCNTPLLPRKVNPGFLRFYNSLRVKCDLLCGNWNGSLGDLSIHHSRECLLHPIQCSHEGCNQTQKRKDMNAIHSQLCLQRKATCRYCALNSTQRELDEHFETCDQYPVKCGNEGCNVVLSRNQMLAHQTNDCPFSIISCEWCEFGCDHKATRKDLKNHHSDSIVKHLDCVKNVITKIMDMLPNKDQVKQALFDLNANSSPSSSSSTVTKESFEIHSRNITDEQLLQQLPPQHNQLKKLKLNDCENLTDISIAKITQNYPQLQYLNLGNWYKITDNTNVQIAQNCPQLQHLDLYYCNQITDSSIAQLAQNCTQLEYLDLGGCNQITDNAVTQIARNCKQLRELDLSEFESRTTPLINYHKTAHSDNV